MENEYPKIKLIKREKWTVLVELYPNMSIGYLKYYLGDNYIRYRQNYWSPETHTEEEQITMTANETFQNKQNYLEKLVDELQSKIYDYEEELPF